MFVYFRTFLDVVLSAAQNGWDSNPRYVCTHTGFRIRLLKPLRHRSCVMMRLCFDLGSDESQSITVCNTSQTKTVIL